MYSSRSLQIVATGLALRSEVLQQRVAAQRLSTLLRVESAWVYCVAKYLRNVGKHRVTSQVSPHQPAVHTGGKRDGRDRCKCHASKVARPAPRSGGVPTFPSP